MPAYCQRHALDCLTTASAGSYTTGGRCRSLTLLSSHTGASRIADVTLGTTILCHVSWSWWVMPKASFLLPIAALSTSTTYRNTAGQHGSKTNSEKQCEAVTWQKRYMPHLFPPC